MGDSNKMTIEQMSDQYFDVLKEIGNIGAGNATTARLRCWAPGWI